MAEPLVVEVRRGGVVEAGHRVHAVAVRDGEIAAAFGDPSLVSFYRSSSKPIQALPLVRARPELDDRLVAIATASHQAEPEQIDAVRSLLAAAPAGEDDLECGLQEGRPPNPLYHNCSGKHAGMLAVCRTRGWPLEGYRLAEHPLQRELLHEVAAAAELDDREVTTAIDGCGVPTFALSLERMAHSFSRFARLDGGSRVLAAMRAHPQLIGGARSLDTRFMRALPGWAAKGGAEGLFCAVAPDGTGVAIKCEDGSQRPISPVLAAVCRRLGHELAGFARVPVLNMRGEEVGEVTVASATVGLCS
jgi:L-asparaginase II